MIKPLGRQALEQFRVNRTGLMEELSWSFYDFTTYNAIGQTSLSFFQSPQGAPGKTFVDTNMDLAGQIPKGQNFLVENICVEFFPADLISDIALTSYADDIKTVAEGGLLTFSVGSKKYKVEGPLGIYPQQYRQAGYAATGLAAGNINYSQNVGKLHEVIPVKLDSNQNFKVVITWPTVLPLPSGVNGRIGVRLGGRLYRNSQ